MKELLVLAAENTEEIEGGYQSREVGGRDYGTVRTLAALVDRGLMQYTCVSSMWGMPTREGLEVARYTAKRDSSAPA